MPRVSSSIAAADARVAARPYPPPLRSPLALRPRLPGRASAPPPPPLRLPPPLPDGWSSKDTSLLDARVRVREPRPPLPSSSSVTSADSFLEGAVLGEGCALALRPPLRPESGGSGGRPLGSERRRDVAAAAPGLAAAAADLTSFPAVFAFSALLSFSLAAALPLASLPPSSAAASVGSLRRPERRGGGLPSAPCPSATVSSLRCPERCESAAEAAFLEPCLAIAAGGLGYSRYCCQCCKPVFLAGELPDYSTAQMSLKRSHTLRGVDRWCRSSRSLNSINDGL